MWICLRGVSRNQAILDLASELGFMSPATRHWLLRELDETLGDPQEALEAAIRMVPLVVSDGRGPSIGVTNGLTSIGSSAAR